ncbi:MAG: ISL3 family transposase [Rhodothermales bacterium]
MARSKTKFAIDLGLSDVKIKRVTQNEQGSYHIYVSCIARQGHCSQCDKPLTRSHGQCKETTIEHIPILEQRVFIHVHWPRFSCPDCDNKTSCFHPNWLNKTGNKTIPFEHYVLKLLINSTVKDVATKLKLTEDIVESILHRQINTDYNWELTQPKVIGFDEIALRKGHSHYLTIVTDLSEPQVKIIGVIDGRTKEDLQPFLQQIPREILFSLQSICIDMGASYFAALEEIINDTEVFDEMVTIDRFHVAKLVGSKADKVRKKITNKLKKEFAEDEEKLEKIKGTMWLFRHHPKDLKEEQLEKLNQFLDYSEELKAVYDLRESLYEIFEQLITPDEASKKIEVWIGKANAYSVFESFIKTYRKFQCNILNYFKHRESSGPVEGINNKIKVVKRRGYGFTNIIYFTKRLFLDINYKSQFMPC